MSLTERCCEDARAIVENPGQEVATEQHFGIRPVGENGPLEGVSLRGERLGREPVTASTFAVVVPAMVRGMVTAFLEAVVQIRPDVVLQRGNTHGELEDAEAIIGLALLADGATLCIDVRTPYAVERLLDLSEVGE